MVAFIQKAHGCIFFYDAIEAQAAQLAISNRQCNERTARGNARTSWRNKTTRGRRNERTTRDDATTNWHDKR
jgi:hypothetical protein